MASSVYTGPAQRVAANVGNLNSIENAAANSEVVIATQQVSKTCFQQLNETLEASAKSVSQFATNNPLIVIVGAAAFYIGLAYFDYTHDFGMFRVVRDGFPSV